MEYNELEHKQPPVDNIYTPIYPSLNKQSDPTAPTGEVHIVKGSAHSYRLQKISEIQKEIEQERDKRSTLSKKYHRSVKIINGVDDVLIVVTIGSGIAGIGLLSTIIAAPIAIGMEAAALGAGAISIIGSQVNKKLLLKAEKHDKIKTLAEAKLNTINDHISKALKDGHISDEEFSLVLGELDKFNKMKEEIRSETKRGISEETKQSLINQGRENAIKSFQNVLDNKRIT